MSIPNKPTGKPLEFNKENFDQLQIKVANQANLIQEYRTNRELRIKLDQVKKQISLLSS